MALVAYCVVMVWATVMAVVVYERPLSSCRHYGSPDTGPAWVC